MKGYLLLRDNRQSGPFTSDELIAKGFKPYDLIWAEGKSAGWRYPGEFPEFRPYAPIIEEQPFDRFYKRDTPSSNSHPVMEQKLAPPLATLAGALARPSMAKETNQTSSTIFVTLPAEKQAPVMEQAQPMSESPATGGVQTRLAPTTPIVGYSNAHQTDAVAPQVSPKPAAPVYFTGTPTRKYSWMLKTAVAACLLLGGIIIGLLINNGRQSAETASLNARIEQIRARQNASNPALVPQNTPAVAEQATLISSNETSQSANPVSTVGITSEPRGNTSQKRAQSGTAATTTANTPVTTGAGKAEPIVFREKNTAQSIQPTEKESNTVSSGTVPESIQHLVALTGNSDYKIGVLGGISGLELTVTNNSLYEIDEVEILVNYLNMDKRVVRSQTLSVQAVKAGDQKTIAVPRSGRGVSVSYSINKVSSRAQELAHSGR